MPTVIETLSKALDLHRAGDLRAAEALYRQVLHEAPDQADARHLLGVLLHDSGQVALGIEYLRRAIALNPAAAAYHYNLGNALRDAGLAEPAIAAFDQAIALNPNYAEAFSNRAVVLQALARLDDAWDSYQRALKLRGEDAVILNNAGSVLYNSGRCQEALDYYTRAIAAAPESNVARGNRLTCLQYLPGTTSQQLAEAHADWNRRHAAPLISSWQAPRNVADAKGRLRLGFVSPDLYRHPVGFFLVRLFQSLDPSQTEIVAYATADTADDLTQRLRQSAAPWRDVSRYDDAALAECIRADRIDILFDLSGHTVGNRLLVFARKPAPVQVTWLGYVGTTGLPAIDYLLADRFHVPPGTERDYCERVVRLPDSWLCYEPPSEAPAVNTLPALGNGWITFGCFNHPAKISPQVVETWSRILHRVAHSRLLLRYRGLDQPSASARYRDLFRQHGIDASRLELRGGGKQADFLASYRDVDLALDPFPYSGGITTCEALWMGVPVVTFPGETFAGRHSTSILSTLGLTETIGRHREDYIETAVSLAQDVARLAAWRRELRSRLANSPLCDGDKFAVAFQAACREMWRDWVRQQAAKPGV